VGVRSLLVRRSFWAPILSQRKPGLVLRSIRVNLTRQHYDLDAVLMQHECGRLARG
jgi:hypothetical protein